MVRGRAVWLGAERCGYGPRSVAKIGFIAYSRWSGEGPAKGRSNRGKISTS